MDIPNEIIDSLDRVRVLEKCSRAALIREAIEDYLQKKRIQSAEAAFGIWAEAPREGILYQNQLRNEWEGR